jgi:hypothetical protein
MIPWLREGGGGGIGGIISLLSSRSGFIRRWWESWNLRQDTVVTRGEGERLL